MEQAGQRSKRQPVSNVVSICGVLFERSRTPLEADFVRWNASTGVLSMGSDECRVLLRALFDTYAEQAVDPRATELDPGYLHATLKRLEAETPGRTADLALIASAYLHFLFESGQWSGNPQEHAAALAAVSAEPAPAASDPDDDQAGYEILFPERTTGQLDAALLDSVFARKVTAFARFLAPGRKTTDTFVLRLSDVPEAAAALGLRARLVGRSIELPPTARFPGRRVGSMGSVDELMRFWDLFRDFPLLHETRTTVRCSAAAEPLLEADAAARARLLRTVATAYFQKSIDGAHMVPLGDMISPFLLEVLLAAASAEPPLAEEIWNGHFTLPGVPSFPSDFLARLLRQELLMLQADGLVEIGEFVSVPGYLRQCLSDALEGLISRQDAPREQAARQPTLQVLAAEHEQPR